MLHLKGFEKFSLLDYDNKISAVFFLGGCNMRCPFCHNADIVLDNKKTEDLSIDDALNYLKERKGLVDGVVISGGEPTIYPELIYLLRDIKEMGYPIKLDTNGTNPTFLKRLCNEKLIDYIAMDIKNSLDKYDETCGKEIDKKAIKESIDFIKNSGLDYEFRTTLIDGYHTLEDIKRIKILLNGSKKYRLQRFVDNDRTIKKGLHEVPYELAKEFVSELKDAIADVSLRGY